MKNKIKTQLTKILSLGLIPLGIATIPTVISTSLTQLQAVQLDSIITNPALGQLNTTTLNDDQMKNVIKLKLADTFTTLKTNAISISALTSTTYTATSIDTNIYTGSVNGTYSTLAAPTDTIASHLGIANDGVYDITYGIGAASGTTGYLQTPIFPLLGTDLPSASDVLKLVNTNVYTSDADTPMNINQIQCVSPSDFSTPITDPIWVPTANGGSGAYQIGLVPITGSNTYKPNSTGDDRIILQFNHQRTQLTSTYTDSASSVINCDTTGWHVRAAQGIEMLGYFKRTATTGTVNTNANLISNVLLSSGSGVTLNSILSESNFTNWTANPSVGNKFSMDLSINGNENWTTVNQTVPSAGGGTPTNIPVTITGTTNQANLANLIKGINNTSGAAAGTYNPYLDGASSYSMFYTEPDISDVKLALQNGGAGVNYSGSATPAAIAQPLSWLEAYCVFPTTRNGTFKVYIGSGSGSYYIGIGNQYTPGTTFDLIVDSYILVNYNLRT